MIYKNFFRKFIFLFPPEIAHKIIFNILNYLPNCFFRKVKNKPIKFSTLKIKNCLGNAAGIDPNGDYIDALYKLGFGFLELGTVTPLPQKGNSKPRLYRLENDLINHIGFCNKGVDYVLQKLKKFNKKKRNITIGINIGKNKNTLIENSFLDYLYCFKKMYKYTDYFTVNISSPNTKNLRKLQEPENLKKIISVLKKEQKNIKIKKNRYIPFFIKISPDLSKNEIIEISKIFIKYKIDGIIATNTTLQHKKKVSGGLSGKSLFNLSNNVLKEFHKQLKKEKIPIIGLGGISSYKDAIKKINYGAKIIQIYTGLIYNGLDLIKDILLNINT